MSGWPVRRTFVLASASPRRSEIVRAMGLRFRVVSTELDEAPRPHEKPAPHVRRLAREKAVAARSLRPSRTALFVGADTIVAIGSRILGKPASAEDAVSMLRRLSGRTHQVLTGVAILDGRNGRVHSAVEVTEVRFRSLSQREIVGYVRTGEPMDKAGAYAIQGGAATFVDWIRGNYLNVVGFPATSFLRLLRRTH
ncbi:MAG: septum formation inhibitor Maf [Acidobacteria bacterium]|nr:septum formation inhibitor Maf [Acidobacteriota bacterium]